MCGHVTGGMILATLRQGCSPLGDLPQDYSRGNAPRFHWRVSPAPAPPSLAASLSLSPARFCPRSLSFRFALPLYHRLAPSFSRYLAIFSPPFMFRPSLMHVGRSFLLPASVLFFHVRPSLSASLSLFPALSSFSLSPSQIILPCLAIPFFFSPVFSSSLFPIFVPFPQLCIPLSQPLSFSRTQIIGTVQVAYSPSLCMRTPRTAAIPSFISLPLSCSTHAVKIFAWPISRQPTVQ